MKRSKRIDKWKNGVLTGLLGRSMDKEHFGSLYLQHYQGIYAMLVRLLQNAQEAEDTMQEAFVRLHEKGGNLSEEEVKPWLYRVATNLALDALRAKKRRRRWLLAFGLSGKIEPKVAKAQPDIAMDVRVVLAHLPHKYAQLLTLHTEGLTHLELSEAMGWKPKTLPKSLLRARRAFKKKYIELTGSH